MSWVRLLGQAGGPQRRETERGRQQSSGGGDQGDRYLARLACAPDHRAELLVDGAQPCGVGDRKVSPPVVSAIAASVCRSGVDRHDDRRIHRASRRRCR